jgi:DNA-binding transcriptional regulator LsrR (DeoR family)
MPQPSAYSDLHLVSKVCTLYYIHEKTQQEIAERLHISRPKVSRLLREAKERGIVRITLSPPAGLHLELENQLEAEFGLEEVQVVDADAGSPEQVKRQIGAGAASYLARTIQPGESIGLGWGTTLGSMVQSMSRMPVKGVRVVQVLGGVGPPASQVHAAELVRQMAKVLNASASLLPAPGIMATADVRDVLRDDQHVRAALSHVERLDVLYTGVSALASSAVLHDPNSALPRGIYEELVEGGAVGHILLRFFTREGARVRTSLDDLILGITPEQLRNTGSIVLVAGGEEKVDAMLGVLRSGYVNVLITDLVTAEALADQARGDPARPLPAAAG